VQRRIPGKNKTAQCAIWLIQPSPTVINSQSKNRMCRMEFIARSGARGVSLKSAQQPTSQTHLDFNRNPRPSMPIPPPWILRNVLLTTCSASLGDERAKAKGHPYVAIDHDRHYWRALLACPHAQRVELYLLMRGNDSRRHGHCCLVHCCRSAARADWLAITPPSPSTPCQPAPDLAA
jgi:hypothetical protein